MVQKDLAVTFENNANGEWDLFNKSSDSSDTVVDFSKIPSALNNQPTLKEFIDADRAIYLGGSSSSGNSSSGGIGDLPEIIASSNFDSKIPDIILLHPSVQKQMTQDAIVSSALIRVKV